MIDHLPDELLIYIISYLDETVYFHTKKRCISYTKTTNYHKKCKINHSEYSIFCKIHNAFSLVEKIISINKKLKK